ncbi:MAG: PTS mannitol transporter subunit IICB [Saccharothrix sp.]|nr:PTS mannitol transporter subunit IICB [Saccharothrix sp.]
MVRFGRFLGDMVLPNMPAFMAWGVLAALFGSHGWFPGSRIAGVIDLVVLVLLPVLIGYTGGRLVYGWAGGVVGALATVGAVAGAEFPMFLAAMVVGPVAAVLLKRFDVGVTGRVSVGFRQLVGGLGGAVIGGGLAVGGVFAVGPAVRWLMGVTGGALELLDRHDALPAASVLIEPARVLFLNNAVNHGVLSPLGVEEASRSGDSILFMLETNPGTGLGVLVAYLVFGPRSVRPSVPGAIAVQFLGGIAEVYFPYVLVRPRLVLAAIAGGASGVAVFQATGVGLLATPAPGSIFAFLAVTPAGQYGGVIAGVVTAAVVSFGVAAALFRFGRDRDVITSRSTG